MDKKPVIVYRTTDNDLPEYKSYSAAGVDFRASEQCEIPPNQTQVVNTGLFVEITDPSCEIQIRSRSSMAKKGIIVANSPGTIDADYRGEIMVILLNTTNDRVTIDKGDRIAQGVLNKIEKLAWKEVNNYSELSNTERGKGGFGHTGIT